MNTMGNDTPLSYEEEFEQELIKVINSILAESEMNHTEFATKLFPKEKSAASKWRRIRNAQDWIGRKQQLKLSEVIRAAEILGTDISTLIWNVQNILKLKQSNTLIIK